ncbi:hypothetical protein U4E84_03865 [Halorubrum sp. AD140]|uniref:hypothetical protein n=1 Tax=Halorubrum sp. AD140 TaxID=3050073 RepID=UPI002ACC9943|nr:hypothetical protein [Halorubrum sp. AD140]MDZ5810488.1 hypothetical protein [Halorubrum sp. AD140]
MVDATDLRVLHLVTAEEVFFTQQIDVLQSKGVDCTVLVVPGQEQVDGDIGVRLYPRQRRERRERNPLETPVGSDLFGVIPIQRVNHLVGSSYGNIAVIGA